MNRPLAFASLLIASALALVAGCVAQPAPAPTPAAGQSPASGATAAPSAATAKPQETRDSLTVGMASLPPNLDPHFQLGQSPLIAHRLAFDTLVFPDEKGEFGPGLASAWRNVDPVTWEFDLIEGVALSDGTPLTPALVKANLERMLGPGAAGNSVASNVATVASADAAGPMKLRVVTKQPDPILPNRMGAVFIVGADYPPKLGDPPRNASTLGTGPYVSASYATNQRYTLELNPNSWRARQNQPTIKTVTLVSMPEPAVLIAAAKTGEIDMAFAPPFEQARELEAAGLKLQSALAPSVLNMIMNITGQPEGGPLRSRDVRLALNYALDKQVLRDVAYTGFGKVADGQLMGANGFGYNPAVRAYPNDPARARQLLQTGGFPQGFTVRVGVTNLGRTFAEPIQAMWAPLGIRAELTNIDLATFLSNFNGGTLDPLTFMGSDYFPLFDGEPVLRRLSNAFPLPVRRWDNPQYHDLYTRSLTELDRNQRQRLLQQAVQVMHDEAPVVPLVEQEWLYSLNPKISGFTARADAAILADRMTFAR